jgi:hypothetical protein
LIELVLPIGVPVESSRPFAIPVAEVAEAVLLLATAVRDGWYRRLFDDSRRVRLDWTLSVTQHVSIETGTHPWEALTFPGRQPRDRAVVPTGHPASVYLNEADLHRPLLDFLAANIYGPDRADYWRHVLTTIDDEPGVRAADRTADLRAEIAELERRQRQQILSLETAT